MSIRDLSVLAGLVFTIWRTFFVTVVFLEAVPAFGSFPASIRVGCGYAFGTGVEYLAHNKVAPDLEAAISAELRPLVETFNLRVISLIVESGGLEQAKTKAFDEMYGNERFSISSFVGLAIVYGDGIAKGLIAPVKIMRVNERVGFGVFANARLKKGEMVGEYTGEVKKGDSSSKSAYIFAFMIYGNFMANYVLDAEKAGNEMRFVNHSQTPNLDFKYVFSQGQWHIIFVANRDVKVGEQLFINYGSSYWKARKPPEKLND